MTTCHQISDLLTEVGVLPKLHRWGKEMRSLKKQASGKSPEAYFFEFESLIRVARHIVVEAGEGAPWKVFAPKSLKYLLWPLTPDVPKDYSYFGGQLDGRYFSIRPGVFASLGMHGNNFSPDISLRQDVSGDVKYAPVVRAWDAKHRTNSNDPIARDELCSFALLQSKLVDAATTSWWPCHLDKVMSPRDPRKKLLSYSGLLTNGKHSTEPPGFVQELGVCETWAFGTSAESTR